MQRRHKSNRTCLGTIRERVRGRSNPPITTEQLAQALVEERVNFPQDGLRRLIRSLQRRLAGKRKPHQILTSQLIQISQVVRLFLIQFDFKLFIFAHVST
jgi:hypothetical protein